MSVTVGSVHRMDAIAEALVRTRSEARALRELEAAGWEVQRTFSMAEVAMVTRDPHGALDALRPTSNGAESVAATCVFGEARVEVVESRDGALSVLDPDPVNFDHTFTEEHRRDARKAWSGDPAAALRLPGEWTVRVVVDLSRELREASPAHAWSVLRTVEDLATLLDSVSVWDLAPTLDPDLPPVFVLEDLGPEELLLLGKGAVVSLASDKVTTTALEGIESVTLDTWHIPELPQAPRPAAIRPVSMHGTELASIGQKLWGATAALAWVGLASSVRRTANDVQIEILGLQRVAYDLPCAGLNLSPKLARRSYELLAWAGGSEAIDQRLAVQQVASLYRDPPWTKIDDVFDAAVAVYSSLRRDSVGEALQARRAARAFALEVAHRATEQVNSVTRSVAERLTASLLAIGGVIVAQTTSVIDAGQATDLRTLVALFLLGLVVWNVAAETPPLRASISDLRADLPRVADTLTDSDVQHILELRSVTSAARRARAITFAVPLVYLLAAVLAWFVQR